MTQKERWFRHYNLAKIYYKENGDLLIPGKYEIKDEQDEIVKLGIWISRQRHAYKNNKLEDWKIKLLEEIKMTWVVENFKELLNKASDKTWLKKYNIAKEYYEKYGNLLIPSTYVVRDNNGEIFNLSYWVKKQRNLYKNNELEDWKMKLLEEIKIVWMSDSWFKNYNIAKEYYEKYGNLLIPSTYVVRDNNGEIFNLSYWVKKQRNLYKNNELEDWKMKLLEEIKIVWMSDSWFKNYNIAKEYYEKYGNLLISSTYVVRDNNGEIFKLSYWVKKQRNLYKNNELEDLKMKLLEEIKIVESEKSKKSNINAINNDTWMKYYLMLKDYKETYGDIFISEAYGSNDLCNWLEVQKNVLVGRKHNDKIKISLLNDIDKNWKNINISYLKKYIEEEYSLYLYGLLDDKSVYKLLNAGAFIYTDDKTIKKASSNEFLEKIKSR